MHAAEKQAETMQANDGNMDQSLPEKRTIRFRGPKTHVSPADRRVESVDLSHYRSGLSNGQEEEEGKKQGAYTHMRDR